MSIIKKIFLLVLALGIIGCQNTSKKLHPILLMTDDSELCDKVFVEINVPLTSLYNYGEIEQTIMSVYQTLGLIGNGGFEYLLYHNISGDPGYGITVKSYSRLKCTKAVECFNEASSLFNVPKVQKIYGLEFENLPFPVFSKDRRDVMDKTDKQLFESLNEKFNKQENYIIKQLAKYIKFHKQEISKLLYDAEKKI